MLTIKTKRAHVEKLMPFMLLVLTGLCAFLGALGIVLFMNGHPWRASASLLIPAYLGFVGWEFRRDLDNEPWIMLFGAAWVVGMLLGYMVHVVGRLMT